MPDNDPGRPSPSSPPPGPAPDLQPLGPISVDDSRLSLPVARPSERADVVPPSEPVLPVRRRRDVGGSTKIARRSSAQLPVNSFDTEPVVDLDSERTGRRIWFGLGLGTALVAQAAAWWFFHASDTFGGALLFAVAALSGFVYPLFQRNSKEVWSRRLSSMRANFLLLVDLQAMFAGLIIGFAAGPLILGPERYAEVFSGIARFVDVHRVSLANLDFSGAPQLLVANLQVLAAFFLIGLVFRYVGVLIVIVWNSASWGVVFAAALSGGMGPGSQDGLLAGLQVAAVAGPHLVLETTGYILASMGGIFLSRAATRYRWNGERFTMVGVVVLRLAAWGVGFVVLAALAEGLWGRWLASHWWSGLRALG